MKTPALIVVVIATVLAVSAARSQEAGKNPADASAKIKELQKERVGVLRDLAEVSTPLLQRGTYTLDEACEAKSLLLNAEIEIAETDAARIKLYEEFVESMNLYEEIARTRKAAARGTEADVIKVKARRLEAQIAMERVRGKSAK